MIDGLKIFFGRLFGNLPTHIFFAPGRVNLIGEYVDFNGGHVFPCAIDLGTYAAVRKRDDYLIRMYSNNFQGQVMEWSLDALVYDEIKDWSNYPIGVLFVLKKLGYELPHGFDVLFEGNLPNGAGLSSSASIEVCMAVMVNQLFCFGIGLFELVKIAQRSENEFNGVNCGIMDQFASGMGRANHAILLNTNEMTHQYVPIKLGDDYTLLIANTNKRRELAESCYNERRSECEMALAALQTILPIKALCALTLTEFEQHKSLIANELACRRAQHVVSENERTLKAVKALARHDLLTFGQLMNESHRSLRDDFEVTGLHLDSLVSSAWEHGAVGARMTGAGFGGCAIILLQTNDVSVFKRSVSEQYLFETGLSISFHDVNIDDGARLLESCL